MPETQADPHQQAVDALVSDYASDFGYDLDEEGQPLEEDDPDRDIRRGGRDEASEEDESSDEDESKDEDEAEDEAA